MSAPEYDGRAKPQRNAKGAYLCATRFTDGSVLGIATGSNASNIAAEHEGLRAEDLHVDFMLTFVPPMT
jgi:hypothetical protein